LILVNQPKQHVWNKQNSRVPQPATQTATCNLQPATCNLQLKLQPATQTATCNSNCNLQLKLQPATHECHNLQPAKTACLEQAKLTSATTCQL
jgi:hypothetical protein